MKQQTIFLAGATLFMSAACSSSDGPQAESAADEETASVEAGATEAMMDDCPVIDSRNWSAWVNAMPGPDAKLTLHVTGEIDLPTPGYEVSWQEGMADRSMMPVQRLALNLKAPGGMVAQVIATETVKYEGPALVRTYGGVIVMCGGETLAEIEEVTVAQ